MSPWEFGVASARIKTFRAFSGAALFRTSAEKTATYFEVDEVIDPADSRKWVATGLLGAERRPGHARKRRPHID
ncbi:MAG: hypothetical protein ACXWRA_00880, partial [Pseudobdellovibrionaceae bacterium]